MSNYPNILTPPMDSPELFSPKSESISRSPPYSTHIANNVDCSDNGYQSWLLLLEEPVEKFRFRYKSEMAGTHGSLTGRNSDRARKQTFPTVKLQNFDQPAIIRCSLFQINQKEPHAHRLVRKVGPDEIDDPHDIEVGPEVGFIANFLNMGIIHTAKKYIVTELIRKYTTLKREEIARKEGMLRLLTTIEDAEVKFKAECECNHINLNQVCLRFDAFRKVGDVLYPIAMPIFSGTINNLKSALTGDLKIVRMDHCTSSSRGGREIFILVEKVTKKNIKVRFFEVDEEENEVWSDFGRFSDLDVHHQYAIVFKTPPYKCIDIDKQVKVSIELLRPSDGARSEPKDFCYTPCEIIQRGKRQRSNYSSYSSSYSSNNLPAILPNDDIVNSKDLEEALKIGVDSEEFEKVCAQLIGHNTGIGQLYIDDVDVNSIALDGPMKMKKMEKKISTLYDVNYINPEEGVIRRVVTEINNFFTTVKEPKKERVQIMLRNLLDNSKYKCSEGNNIIHLLIKNNQHQEFLLNLLAKLVKYELPSIADIRNHHKKTAMHFAVSERNKKVMEFLLLAKTDLKIPDAQGNTPLHYAIMKEAPEDLLHLFFKCGQCPTEFVDIPNHDGNTPLHLAIKTNNVYATKILCINKANVNLHTKTSGYTPLHMAVADQHIDIVKYLLECNCDTDLADYNGNTPLKFARVLIHEDKPITSVIYDMLEIHMKNQGVFSEVLIKEEEPLEDSDMEVEDKTSLEYKYSKISHLSEQSATKISDIIYASGSWTKLAKQLTYDHLLSAQTFSDASNPARSLLDFIMAMNNPLYKVRDILCSLKETEVVDLLDLIVKEEDEKDEED